MWFCFFFLDEVVLQSPILTRLMKQKHCEIVIQSLKTFFIIQPYTLSKGAIFGIDRHMKALSNYFYVWNL